LPHLKCEACRARLRYAGVAKDPALRCPLCGGPLEPVAALSQIVGFRAVVPEQAAPQSAASRAGHQRLAERVAEVMAHRRRSVERATRAEADRWAP
jgi:hypothetical protein